jgi:DNA transformation protein
MSTQKETVEFILEKLGSPEHFSTRAMFGEYALYANGKTVGLICDDQLYVKIVPASIDLEQECEKGEPYPGAKEWYIVDEGLLSRYGHLSELLIAIADSLPLKVKKQRSGRLKK